MLAPRAISWDHATEGSLNNPGTWILARHRRPPKNVGERDTNRFSPTEATRHETPREAVAGPASSGPCEEGNERRAVRSRVSGGTPAAGSNPDGVTDHAPGSPHR